MGSADHGTIPELSANYVLLIKITMLIKYKSHLYINIGGVVLP